MKNTLLIFALSITSFVASGQAISLDSLNRKYEAQQAQIEHIQDCMIRHHKAYSTGIAIEIVGILAMVGGAAYSSSDSQLGTNFVIGGGILTAIGGLVVIGSDRWFGRAKKTTL